MFFWVLVGGRFNQETCFNKPSASFPCFPKLPGNAAKDREYFLQFRSLCRADAATANRFYGAPKG
jgi:hypothetical protein